MTDDAFPDGSNRSRRRIGRRGTLARIGAGTALIVAAAAVGLRWHDLVIGLVVFPAISVLALLVIRGRSTFPLRLHGARGQCLNNSIWVLAFIVAPRPTLLFYGSAMLLAAARGYAGCEVLAVSNWLRRRDDEIGCAFFRPIDNADAASAGREAA